MDNRGELVDFPLHLVTRLLGKPGTDGTFSDNFVPPMARLGRVV